jgi:hypothetical protein
VNRRRLGQAIVESNPHAIAACDPDLRPGHRSVVRPRLPLLGADRTVASRAVMTKSRTGSVPVTANASRDTENNAAAARLSVRNCRRSMGNFIGEP